MGLKILHSADWHLDAPFGSFTQEQRDFLRRSQRRIPEEIAALCRRENCDIVLLAGDLFDGTPTRDTLDSVKRALEQCAVPVFIAPGNHDYCGTGSVWQEENWPENVTIFTGKLESVTVPALDCRVYGAGYQSMDCPALLDGFRAEGQEKYCLAVLHADPVTKDSPYCPVTARQIRESGLDYLALGHIHKGGSLIQGSTLCVWPGCAMGRGWDETGEKGICIVTLGEKVKADFVPLPLPRFYDLETETDAEELNDLLPAQGSEDFYRITLTGYGPVDVQQLRQQLARFPNLTLRDQTQPKPDLWGEAGEDTLRGVYFRLLREKSETNPDAQLAAEISHRILSGREVLLP